jgi:hypothetical protein
MEQPFDQFQPQYEHACTLIELLHPNPHAGALIEITAMSSKYPLKRYFFYANLAAEAAIEYMLTGANVFVGVNPRNAFSGFERDVPIVTAIALDQQPEKLAIEEVEHRLRVSGILPTAVANSGNGAHYYFRLSEPTDPVRAKTVWARLCRFTNGDTIFNTNRIMRVPGTLNYKTTPGRWCALTCVTPERRYTIDEIDAALDRVGAGPARPHKPGVEVPVNPTQDWFELFKNLPEAVRYAIETGERNPLSDGQITRSEADWMVICSLVRAGASDETVIWCYEKMPIGNLKYHEAGVHYLTTTLRAARRATAEPVEPVGRGYARDAPKNARGSSGDAYRKPTSW